MFRSAKFVVACVASALSVSAAIARPAYIKFDGIDGEVIESSTFNESFIGGVRVAIWNPGSGGGSGKVSFSDSGSANRPMESMSLNFTKVPLDSARPGSSHTVADDVWVDGRIITSALWARWSVGPNGEIRFDYGKAADVPGTIRLVLRSGGVPVAQHSCTGDVVGCWILTALCPQLECNIMCPELCGAAQWDMQRDDLGGVSIRSRLSGPSTFLCPDNTVVTADEISVVLVPTNTIEPMRLISPSATVEGLAGLVIRQASGELVCPADMDASGELSISDVFTYLNFFFAGDDSADFDESGEIRIEDVFGFLQAFFNGCP